MCSFASTLPNTTPLLYCLSALCIMLLIFSWVIWMFFKHSLVCFPPNHLLASVFIFILCEQHNPVITNTNTKAKICLFKSPIFQYIGQHWIS